MNVKQLISKLNDKVKHHYSIIEILAVSGVVALSLILRLVFVFKLPHPPLLTDAYNYDVMTKQFLSKGFLGYLSTFPNAYVTPGYPLFLAIIYKAVGYHSGSPLTHVRVIQAILGALTCLIMYIIGKRLKNRKVGFLAAFLFAIYPPFVWSTTLILTEVLYLFFFLIYFYLQIITLEKKSSPMSFLCGLTFALAVLVRPVVFPLFIILFVYHYLFVDRDKAIIKCFMYGTVGVLALMIPWWLRNIITMHKFIFLATQTGNPLLGGAFPYFQNIDSMSQYIGKDQFQAGIKIIINGLLAQPVLFLKWFTIGKFKYIFDYPWYYVPGWFTFLRRFLFIHDKIIFLGWLGVVFLIFRNKIRLVAITTLLITGLQLLFIPEARYAYSIIPLLMISMAYLLDYIFFSSIDKDRSTP